MHTVIIAKTTIWKLLFLKHAKYGANEKILVHPPGCSNCAIRVHRQTQKDNFIIEELFEKFNSHTANIRNTYVGRRLTKNFMNRQLATMMATKTLKNLLETSCIHHTTFSNSSRNRNKGPCTTPAKDVYLLTLYRLTKRRR